MSNLIRVDTKDGPVYVGVLNNGRIIQTEDYNSPGHKKSAEDMANLKRKLWGLDK